jgi:hypothetical protein
MVVGNFAARQVLGTFLKRLGRLFVPMQMLSLAAPKRFGIGYGRIVHLILNMRFRHVEHRATATIGAFLLNPGDLSEPRWWSFLALLFVSCITDVPCPCSADCLQVNAVDAVC